MKVNYRIDLHTDGNYQKHIDGEVHIYSELRLDSSIKNSGKEKVCDMIIFVKLYIP